MTSPARQSFVGGLSALRAACDEPAVIASTDSASFLRRGLTVSAFNLLETFVADRWSELAAHMNGGHTQFLDLPEKMQRRAIARTVAVAQTRLRRDALELVDLRHFSSDIGQSLSAVATNLSLSPLTWMWEGSNMSADEFHGGLRHIHVASPFESIREASGRLGFPVVDAVGDPINLREDLTSLAKERHQCAHVASHGVTTIWLRAVPDRVLRFGLGFDIYASIGAHLLRSGDVGFLGKDDWVDPTHVKFRFVKERASDFAEVLEGRTKAAHVDSDGDRLFGEACSRAPDEVVVRLTATGQVTNWSIPRVG